MAYYLDVLTPETTSDEAWDEMDEPSPFPPMPAIQSQVFSRRQMAQDYPAFETRLALLTRCREQAGHPPYMAGLIAPRSLLGRHRNRVWEEDLGYALVLQLPEEFEPCLPELATQKPYLYCQHSLDCLSAETVHAWYCTLADGRNFNLLVPERPLLKSGMFNVYEFGNQQGDHAVFISVVWVAGHSVACGGFWHDAHDMLLGQAASMSSDNFNPYRVYDQAELEAASLRAREAGSGCPWAFRPWQDEDGTFLMRMHIVQLRAVEKEDQFVSVPEMDTSPHRTGG